MRSLRRGAGTDVAGSRPYRPGDDIDTIDWAASAELSTARGSDEFVVRERFAEEAPRGRRRLRPPPGDVVLRARRFRGSTSRSRCGTVFELILAQRGRAGGFVGYLDYADGTPFWRPPQLERKLMITAHHYTVNQIGVLDTSPKPHSMRYSAGYGSARHSCQHGRQGLPARHRWPRFFGHGLKWMNCSILVYERSIPGTPRRNHSPAFKAKVALQAIRDDKTLAELAQQHQVHAYANWPSRKQQLLEHAADVLANGGRAAAAQRSAS